ncbi:hypothetical protein [Brotaphodocola sp.]
MDIRWALDGRSSGGESSANALSLRVNQRKRHWRFLDTLGGCSGA